MLSGHPSVTVSVLLRVRPGVRVPISLLKRYLRTQWREFHQTLVDDVVEAEDELIRF